MPRRSPPPPFDDRDERISRLEQDLFAARMSLVAMADDECRPFLEAHWRVRNYSDMGQWTRWAVDGLVEIAYTRIVFTSEYFNEKRALCPLCRGRASSGYVDGYKLPIGLERHIEGTHRNLMCPVFGAAYDLARGHMREYEREGRPVPRDERRPDPPWIPKPPSAAPPPAPGESGPSATVIPLQRRSTAAE